MGNVIRDILYGNYSIMEQGRLLISKHGSFSGQSPVQFFRPPHTLLHEWVAAPPSFIQEPSSNTLLHKLGNCPATPTMHHYMSGKMEQDPALYKTKNAFIMPDILILRHK